MKLDPQDSGRTGRRKRWMSSGENFQNKKYWGSTLAIQYSYLRFRQILAWISKTIESQQKFVEEFIVKYLKISAESVLTLT